MGIIGHCVMGNHEDCPDSQVDLGRCDCPHHLYESVGMEYRTCDTCHNVSGPGEFPDWVNGICDLCDPSIFDHPDNKERMNG